MRTTDEKIASIWSAKYFVLLCLFIVNCNNNAQFLFVIVLINYIIDNHYICIMPVLLHALLQVIYLKSILRIFEKKVINTDF